MQRAGQMLGMALAPAPTRAPEGVRVSPGAVETKDRLGGGAFLGERREELTYLLTRPGGSVPYATRGSRMVVRFLQERAYTSPIWYTPAK